MDGTIVISYFGGTNNIFAHGTSGENKSRLTNLVINARFISRKKLGLYTFNSFQYFMAIK